MDQNLRSEDIALCQIPMYSTGSQILQFIRMYCNGQSTQYIQTRAMLPWWSFSNWKESFQKGSLQIKVYLMLPFLFSPLQLTLPQRVFTCILESYWVDNSQRENVRWGGKWLKDERNIPASFSVLSVALFCRKPSTFLKRLKLPIIPIWVQYVVCSSVYFEELIESIKYVI